MIDGKLCTMIYPIEDVQPVLHQPEQLLPPQMPLQHPPLPGTHISATLMALMNSRHGALCLSNIKQFYLSNFTHVINNESDWVGRIKGAMYRLRKRNWLKKFDEKDKKMGNKYVESIYVLNEAFFDDIEAEMEQFVPDPSLYVCPQHFVAMTRGYINRDNMEPLRQFDALLTSLKGELKGLGKLQWWPDHLPYTPNNAFVFKCFSQRKETKSDATAPVNSEPKVIAKAKRKSQVGKENEGQVQANEAQESNAVYETSPKNANILVDSTNSPVIDSSFPVDSNIVIDNSLLNDSSILDLDDSRIGIDSGFSPSTAAISHSLLTPTPSPETLQPAPEPSPSYGAAISTTDATSSHHQVTPQLTPPIKQEFEVFTDFTNWLDMTQEQLRAEQQQPPQQQQPSDVTAMGFEANLDMNDILQQAAMMNGISAE